MAFYGWCNHPNSDDWVTSLQVNSNAKTYLDDGDDVENITHTLQNYNFSESQSNTSDPVQTYEDANYIGGYYGDYVRQDDYSATEFVVDLAFGVFTKKLDDVLYGAGTTVAEMFDFWESASNSNDSVRREWRWDREIQTSWWSKIDVRLNPNETFDIDMAESISTFGNTDGMFGGTNITLEAPDEPSQSTTISTDSANGEGNSNQVHQWEEFTGHSRSNILKHSSKNLYAFSGQKVMNNPKIVGWDKSQIEKFGIKANHVIYWSPKKPTVVGGTRQTPEDLQMPDDQ